MMCIDTHLNTKILVKQSENHGGKMSYILGIDQGRTKTAAAIMDEGERYWGLQPEEAPTIRQTGWHLRLQK